MNKEAVRALIEQISFRARVLESEALINKEVFSDPDGDINEGEIYDNVTALIEKALDLQEEVTQIESWELLWIPKRLRDEIAASDFPHIVEQDKFNMGERRVLKIRKGSSETQIRNLIQSAIGSWNYREELSELVTVTEDGLVEAISENFKLLPLF